MADVVFRMQINLYFYTGALKDFRELKRKIMELSCLIFKHAAGCSSEEGDNPSNEESELALLTHDP